MFDFFFPTHLLTCIIKNKELNLTKPDTSLKPKTKTQTLSPQTLSPSPKPKTHPFLSPKSKPKTQILRVKVIM